MHEAGAFVSSSSGGSLIVAGECLQKSRTIGYVRRLAVRHAKTIENLGDVGCLGERDVMVRSIVVDGHADDNSRFVLSLYHETCAETWLELVESGVIVAGEGHCRRRRRRVSRRCQVRDTRTRIIWVGATASPAFADEPFEQKICPVSAGLANTIEA